MIPITHIPTEEIREFRLSDPQWSRLIEFINPQERISLDVARQKLDYAAGMYLWFTFNASQSITPSKFSEPFKRLVDISNDLFLFLENYFFPAYLKWPDTLCSDVVKERINGSASLPEEALIKEEPKEMVVDGYNISQRNELIRIAMTERLEQASRDLALPFLQMEALLKSIYELRAVAQKTLETLPSAKGKHGDPYLDRLIADAQIIYCDAGGRGLYTNDAVRFLALLMEYVAAFSRRHIGEGHACSLEKSVREDKITEKIKTARRKMVK